MTKHRLSSLYYDFIPTSFISASVPVNAIIEELITSAVTGKITVLDKDEFVPYVITLSPIVQPFEVEKSLQLIDGCFKRHYRLKPKIVLDHFCVWKNLEVYINSKPTCFFVLGKPSPMRYRLAKYVAQKTGRYHIDVVRLVAREIIKNTPLGNWMWANLAWGKKIPIDICMRLLLDELGKKKYQRNGYVLSGLPIIPTCALNEDLLPFAIGKFPCVPPPYVSKIKRKRDMKDTEQTDHKLEEIIVHSEGEEEELSEESKASSIKKDDEKDGVEEKLQEEVEQEFEGFEGEISEEEGGSEEEFVTTSEESEDEDLERDARRLDFARQGTYQLPKTEEAISYSIESQLILLLDLQMPPDIIFYLAYDNEDIIAKKRNIQYEETELLLQFVRYESSFQVIQSFLLHYDKKTVIRMDGRLSSSELYRHTDNRLEYLHYKKLFKPIRLFLDDIPEKFQQLDNDQCLQLLCETNTIQRNFNWLKTDFQTYCPIESFKGKRVHGAINFAVRYLGYNFLMSSEENVNKFLKDPNKYILPMPNCRIAIIGPRRVGKTIIAKMLSYLLNAEIYHMKRTVCELYDEFCENKYSEAFKYAYDLTKELAKTKFEHYTRLTKDKIEEWKDNVLINIKDALDPLDLNKSAFSLDDIAKFLQNKDELNELIPAEWRTEPKYEEPSYSDPLVKCLLQEKLMELYLKSLTEEGHIAKHFLEFAKEKDIQILRDTNGEQEYGQWIIEDPPLDITFWEELDKNNCLPDVVIFLSNCSEEKWSEIYGHGLNAKFYSGRYIANQCIDLMCHHVKKQSFNIDRIVKSLKDIIPMNESIAEYGKFLAVDKCKKMHEMFESVQKLEEFLNLKNSTLLTTNISKQSWSKIVVSILRKYFYLFKSQPRHVNYAELCKLNGWNDGIEVSDDAEEMPEEEIVEEDEDTEEEEEEEKESKTSTSEKDILKNVRLGNTGKYCAVMYTDHDILVKGCPEYCIEYDNLIYPLSSQECFLKFMVHPEKYTQLHHKPFVPPPKIWVIGPNHIEKFLFSINLSDELLTKLIVYNKLVNEFIQTTNVTEEVSLYSLHDIDNVCLNDSMVSKLKKSFKNGAIMSGFPARKEQFQELIDNNLYPEAIFVMDDREVLLQVLYNHQLELWQRKQITPREEETTNEEDYYREFFRYEGGVEKDSSEEIEICEEGEEEECEFRTLTEADKKEVYELCKKTLEGFLVDLDEMIILANNLNIPIIKIPKYFRQPGIITRLRRKINNYSDRFSMFDQIFLVSFETAIQCIDCGFSRLSRFNNSCPVDVQMLIGINHYMGSKEQKILQPCIFHEFVYFINGKKNLCRFKLNPYKYINTCKPYQYNVPLRIVVLGPTSTDCTILCQRIAKEFHMEIFTEEDFKNIINKKLYWTALYREFSNNNNELTDDILANCLLYYENITPNGIILNNFPFDPEYSITVAKYNVDFQIMLIIKPNFETIWKNWTIRNGKKKFDSVEKLYELYNAYKLFMENLDILQSIQELQLFNISIIDRTNCNWIIWSTAKNEIFTTVRSIISYEWILVKQKTAASLSHINIFQAEYKARQASIGPFCPICALDRKLARYRYDYLNVGKRFYENKCQEELLRPFGYNSKNVYQEFKFPHPFSTNPTVPPLLMTFSLKSNLVQYRCHFYWSCDNHIIELLLNTSNYLPIDLNYLPPYVPVLVLNYMKIFVEHEGYCVVTYERNLPDHILVKGDPKYAIYYRGKVFLVASETEALEFLFNPQKYYHVRVKLDDQDKLDLDVESMKLDLGALTPSLIALVLEEVAKFRPKHFAMNATESAATFMGLFLKLYKYNKVRGKNEVYEEIYTNFMFECKILQNRLDKFKRNINPFIVQDTKEDELDYESAETMSCRSLD